jgi:hypothetical protein
LVSEFTVYHTTEMEDILSTQFDRVEKALTTLVDSIAAYNPSPQAALDLVAADDQLSQGLDQRKTSLSRDALITDCRQLPDTKPTMPASSLCEPRWTLLKSSSKRRSRR